MKHLYLISASVILLLSFSCKSDKAIEEEITIKPFLGVGSIVLQQHQMQILSMHDVSIYNSRFATTKEYPEIDPKEFTWSSADTYIAEVSEYGVVTGKHVGKTKLYVTGFDMIDSCDITISPQHYYVYEPIIDWGISKQELIVAEPYMVDKEEDDNVRFAITRSENENKGKIFYDVKYWFKDNELTYCQTILTGDIALDDINSNLTEIFDKTNAYPTREGESFFEKKGCVVMSRELNSKTGIEVIYAKDAKTIRTYFSE